MIASLAFRPVAILREVNPGGWLLFELSAVGDSNQNDVNPRSAFTPSKISKNVGVTRRGTESDRTLA